MGKGECRFAEIEVVEIRGVSGVIACHRKGFTPVPLGQVLTDRDGFRHADIAVVKRRHRAGRIDFEILRNMHARGKRQHHEFVRNLKLF